MTRETMNQIILGQTTGEKEVKAGNVTIDGNAGALTKLVSYLDSFEFWFNIVTP